MTEGPYWVDEMLRRFDVRGNTPSASSRRRDVEAGVPLTLKINVRDASGGGAINGAHVDIWHANAYGLYSDEGQQQTGGGTTTGNTQGAELPARLPGHGHRRRRRSRTRSTGRSSFKTIWPGWYQGRAIHIHVRVRTYDPAGTVATNYTTQIFFSDQDNSTVLTGAAPYNSRSPKTDPTTDENDNVLTAAADATNIVPVAGSLAERLRGHLQRSGSPASPRTCRARPRAARRSRRASARPRSCKPRTASAHSSSRSRPASR